MAINSRIGHPKGASFVQIQRWIVVELGLPCAAVIGHLDFLDSATVEAGQPLATRQRIIADLEGIIGRNCVDKAIQTLVELGWLVKIERTTVNKNITTWFEFALDAEAINNYLSGKPGVPKPGNPASRNRDQNRDQNRDRKRDAIYINKEEEKEREAAAAVPKTKNLSARQGGLAEKLNSLMLTASKLGGDAARDADNRRFAEKIAAAVGEEEVLSAIVDCTLPSHLQKALTGLDEVAAKAEAEHKKKEAEARRQVMLNNSKEQVNQLIAQGGGWHQPAYLSKRKVAGSRGAS